MRAVSPGCFRSLWGWYNIASVDFRVGFGGFVLAVGVYFGGFVVGWCLVGFQLDCLLGLMVYGVSWVPEFRVGWYNIASVCFRVWVWWVLGLPTSGLFCGGFVLGGCLVDFRTWVLGSVCLLFSCSWVWWAVVVQLLWIGLGLDGFWGGGWVFVLGGFVVV